MFLARFCSCNVPVFTRETDSKKMRLFSSNGYFKEQQQPQRRFMGVVYQLKGTTNEMFLFGRIKVHGLVTNSQRSTYKNRKVLNDMSILFVSKVKYNLSFITSSINTTINILGITRSLYGYERDIYLFINDLCMVQNKRQLLTRTINRRQTYNMAHVPLCWISLTNTLKLYKICT